MNASLFLRDVESFWFQRATEENAGILTLEQDDASLNLYGTWEQFEALGGKILAGVEELRKNDKIINIPLLPTGGSS